MSASPYTPPQAALVDAAPGGPDDAVPVREAHLRHEVQLKSVGLLYYLGGLGMAAAIVAGVLGVIDRKAPQPAPSAAILVPLLVYVAFGAGAFAIGYGFRGLRPWVKIPGTIFAVLGLISFPVGTLINGWILYLMHGRKGRTVLGPDYRRIIAATPQVKYRRGVGEWIVLGLLLALLVGLLVLLVATTLRR